MDVLAMLAARAFRVAAQLLGLKLLLRGGEPVEHPA
jgi:hypothetical protein